MSRDQLLRRLRDQLEAYWGSGRPDLLLNDDVEREALDLAELLGGVTDDIESIVTLALIFYYRYQHLPEGDDENDRQRVVTLIRVIRQIPLDSMPLDLRAAASAAFKPIAQHVDWRTVRRAALQRVSEAWETADANAAREAVRLLRHLLENVRHPDSGRAELAG